MGGRGEKKGKGERGNVGVDANIDPKYGQMWASVPTSVGAFW